jgi:hypothetical protein
MSKFQKALDALSAVDMQDNAEAEALLAFIAAEREELENLCGLTQILTRRLGEQEPPEVFAEALSSLSGIVMAQETHIARLTMLSASLAAPAILLTNEQPE